MGCIYQRGRTWWIKYRQDGLVYRETSSSTKARVATRLLRLREGAVEHGVPVIPKMDRITFHEAAQDIINDYEANGKKSIRMLRQRITKHLRPFFRGRRMATIRATDMRAFVRQRQEAGASNGEINRELTTLKRMFSLAVEADQLTRRPKIPMLAERAPRSGFFEHDQIQHVCRHLPPPIAAVIMFAYLTGWRVHAEILTLTWDNVDWKGQGVRLERGTTKTGEPRVFPFTQELGHLLRQQRAEQDRLKRTGVICPFVFHRDGQPIKSFTKAWRTACRAAGCPGRIPHDLRRTAVRNLERAGVPRSTAMAMVGHKTESIYLRYAIVDEAMRREAAAKLDSFAVGHNLGHNTPLPRPTGTETPQNP